MWLPLPLSLLLYAVVLPLCFAALSGTLEMLVWSLLAISIARATTIAELILAALHSEQLQACRFYPSEVTDGSWIHRQLARLSMWGEPLWWPTVSTNVPDDHAATADATTTPDPNAAVVHPVVRGPASSTDAKLPTMSVPRGSRVWICGAVFETLNDVTVEGAGAEGCDTYASYMEKHDTPFDGLAIAKMLQQAGVNYAVTGPNGEVLTNQRA